MISTFSCLLKSFFSRQANGLVVSGQLKSIEECRSAEHKLGQLFHYWYPLCVLKLTDLSAANTQALSLQPFKVT